MNPNTLRLAREFYFRKLNELNPYILATPAVIHKLNQQAEAIRFHLAKTETNPVWRLRVRIEPDGTSPTRFEVILEDP
jgi:hypothetical protein